MMLVSQKIGEIISDELSVKTKKLIQCPYNTGHPIVFVLYHSATPIGHSGGMMLDSAAESADCWRNGRVARRCLYWLEDLF